MTAPVGVGLPKRIAVVTGSTRGIGREIALALAARGDSVVVVGRTSRVAGGAPLPGSVEDTVDEINRAGGTAIGVQADLCDENDTEAIIEQTLSHFGRCDLLVNNAAYTSNGPMLEIPWHRWARAFRVQVVAPHQLCHGFVPGMRERRTGSVLNISSGASQSVTPGLGLYSTSKLAMERWSEYLDHELEGSGISVNTLRVDRLVATEGWRHVRDTQGAAVASGGAPDAIVITSAAAAAAAVWLADQAPAVSGRTLGFADIELLGGPAVEVCQPDTPDTLHLEGTP